MLYNSKTGNLDTSNFEFFCEGSCARIYKDNNIILKVYKIDSPYSASISKNTFNKLKSLKINHIVKLYNQYYKIQSSLVELLKCEAYTMDYVPDPKLTIINYPTEFLLELAHEMEAVNTNLTKHRIIAGDGHKGNIIFNENGLTIIDVDTYREAKLLPSNLIRMHNRKELLSYLRSKLYDECINNDINTLGAYNAFLAISSSNKPLPDAFNEIFQEETPAKTLKKIK